jgi:putative RecB family exonuclease
VRKAGYATHDQEPAVQYSHSRIACFEQCPLKFKLTYLERPPIEIPEGIEAFLGTMVHESLQRLYDLHTAGKALKRAALLEHFSREWAKRLPPDVRIVRRELEADDYRRVGLRCLALYYDRYSPFDQGITVATEHRLTFPIGGPDGPTVLGYIDRLTKTGCGLFEIHDYKTAGRLPSKQALDTDRQLALYELGLRRTWPEPVSQVELTWHYLRFDSELRSRRTEADLARVEQETLGSVSAIAGAVKAGSFPPREGALCPWCDFRVVCPVFSHEESTASMAADDFRADAGVTLVDEYAAVDLQEKEARARKQELRQRIIELATEKGYTRLVGSAHQIGISSSTRGAWPSPKGEPESYAELAKLLREAGLWDQVSELSPARLEHVLEESCLPEDSEKLLSRFRCEKEQHTVRLSRRRDLDD